VPLTPPPVAAHVYPWYLGVGRPLSEHGVGVAVGAIVFWFDLNEKSVVF